MMIFPVGAPLPPSGVLSAEGNWVAGFWLLCGLFLLLRLWVGWQEGLARQLFTLAAIALAWWAAFTLGPTLAPGLRPFLPLPDLVLSVLTGALVGLVVYNVVNILGRTLTRRTRELEPGPGRLVWGVGGMALGAVGALVNLWVIFIGLRLLGSVADGHVRAEELSRPSAGVRRHDGGGAAPTPNTTLETGLRGLAEVKGTLEAGVVGEVVAAVDPVPARVYATLNKLARVFSDPAALGRFRNGVFVREFGADPRLAALLDDPAVTRDLAAKDYRALLTSPRLREAANDRGLAARLKRFDLERALDEALEGKG